MNSKSTNIVRRLLSTLVVMAAVLMLNSVVMAAPTPKIYQTNLTSKTIRLCAQSNSLVEYQIRKFSGGKLIDSDIMPYYITTTDDIKYQVSAPISIGFNTVYKFRVRTVNQTTGAVGSWSAYKFYIPKLTIKGTTSTAYRGQIKLAIRNIKGVKQYKIYTSTSKDSGFTLKKTINATSATSVSTYVSAVSGKTNYVDVVAVLTNGKTANIGNLVYGSVY